MADYIKLTPEVCEALQRPHRTIINLIRDGKLKGKIFSARDWRVDTCELPSDFLAKLNLQNPSENNTAGNLPDSIGQTQPLSTPKPPEAPINKPLSETSKALQDVQDNIRLLDLRAKEAEAEIKLQEIQRKRDLPQTIIERDKASLQRESLVKQREDSIAQREISVGQRELNIKQAETEIVNKAAEADNYVKAKSAEANRLMADADYYDKQKRKEADEYYAAKVETSNDLNAQIMDKQAELYQLNNEIPHKANELIKTLKGWTGYASRQANMLQMQTHYTKASNVWNIKDALEKIIHSLGG